MDDTEEILPPVNPVVAKNVLTEVDNIIDWKNTAVKKFEKAGIRLARLISDIVAHGYWTARGYKSEVDYVKNTFPQSESQYYILRRIGTTLKDYPTAILEEIGISKCQDLVRIYNYCGGMIGPQWWVWAKNESRDEFRRRVRSFVTKALPPAPNNDEDLIVHFKIWKEAIPIYNKSFEIAGILAGNTNSKSHLLCNFILPEWLSGMDEDGARLMGQNNFILTTIGKFIRSLDVENDDSVLDRLIGEIRSAISDLKEK